ncbi:glycosyltransferase [Leptolyngbya sp. AN03gr2]|uniref:glycosyltransferase n=1 Tax=unclassified Leptolyngbya TaxID=2650499 RepID=UPI003D31D287
MFSRLISYAAVSAAIVMFVNAVQQQDWLDPQIEAWMIEVQFWLRQLLSLEDFNASWQTVLFPAVISFSITIALKLFFTDSTSGIRKIASALMLFLAVRYLLWRVLYTLNLSDPVNGSLSLLALGIELLAFIQNISSMLLMCWRTDRTAQADKASEAVLEESYAPWVDILIPTYNEPVALLRRTIIGCQALKYERKSIYLLDDQRRPEMRSLAAELGCNYVDRPDNRHAKAGNINHALQFLEGDLITVFDADFIPTQNFLHRTIGLFQDPTVALVQTPQTFYNSDPIRYNLGLEGVLTNEQDFFFRAIQPGRDGLNSTICCGTSFVVRRDLLNQIGGIPTETLCEDLCTSMHFQSLGYQVLYLNESLSAGASAENISSFIDQRLRWAQGTLQTLFSSYNPLRMQGLTFAQRGLCLLGILSWFLFGLNLVMLLMPLTYLWFGFTPLLMPLDGLLSYWLPCYLGNIILLSWLSDRKRSFFWGEIYAAITCFPIALITLKTLINPFGKRFKVTPKGVTAKGIRFNWKISFPIIVLIGLYSMAIVWGGLTWNFSALNDATLINLGWAIYNMAILLIALQTTIDVPQKVLSLNFFHQLECGLMFQGKWIEAETIQLSEQGIQLRADLALPIGATAQIDVPQIGLFNVAVEVTSAEDSIFSLRFTDLPLSQERQLISFLFCKPGQWQEEFISETKSLSSFVWSIFRLYPLADT